MNQTPSVPPLSHNLLFDTHAETIAMTRQRSPVPIIVLLLASLLLLGACGKRATDDSGQAPAVEISTIEKTMKQAREDVRKHVIEGNITLRSDDRSVPKGEITPAGDLLIGGKTVEVDANQRALLLQYRGHVAELAATGAEIGIQGAELATRAMGEAFSSLFSGDTEGMEKRVEAQAEKIEVQARMLCDQMPAMLETQQALADALPEFRPYATMDADDIKDCRMDSDADVASQQRAREQSRIREAIRGGIRSSIQAAVQSTGRASSGTTDAAADAEANDTASAE